MKLFVYTLIFITTWITVIQGCKKHNEIIPVEDSLLYTTEEVLNIYYADSTQPFQILSAFNTAHAEILKKHSHNVKISSDTTKYLVNRMFRTISNYQGNINGITAPEIGINRNIIILKRKDKTGNPFEVFINPKITQHSNASTEIQDSCITSPGVFPSYITRYNLISVEYYSMDGRHHSEMIEMETAAILQHEMAHLNGGVLAFTVDPLAFTGSEIDTIMADTLAMRIYLTTNLADSMVLRKTSVNVRPDSTNAVLIRIISRMRKALASTSGGVGIAAPQVGINRNIILVKRLDKIGKPVEVYLNPKIVNTTTKMINFAGDGCLSIPNVTKTTVRFAAVGIEYDLPDGTHHSEIVEGFSGANFTAVIFQHEIDHLNGILFIDRAL
ncbi:MAG: peptide deformylase [Bacteroidia bacterium]|nr:peptide deformylase [Bacteroidia bacterium]